MKCFISQGKKLLFGNAFALLMVSLAQACPLCKEALSAGLAKGFFWSILLMLAMPFLVVGVIATWWWRAHRKQEAAKAFLFE
jgi:heme/copper-type cytochrome/quinol oxidase subunit 2